MLRILAATLFCGPVPASEPPASSRPPVPTSAVSPVPTDDAYSRYAAAAKYSAAHDGRAVLIVKDGKTVFEQYDNGWSADRPHPLASGTKSFTGIMAMMAVQDGLLTLDEKVSDTITEWQNDPKRSLITVRHLLTLSSGLDASPVELESRGGSLILGEGARLRAERKGLDKAAPPPRDLAKASVGDTIKLKHTPGEIFEYGPTHFYVFCELLNRKLAAAHRPEKSTADYLDKRVFDAIGINVGFMGRDRAGNPNLPGGCLLTARQWAKLGQFVLDHGAVRAADGSMKALLKPELLSECFVPSNANHSYGLTWWLLTDDQAAGEIADGAGPLSQLRNQRAQTRAVKGPDGKPLRVYMAAGLGKQRLYVIPQYNTIVVRFAEATRQGTSFDNAEFLKPLLGLN